MLKEVARIMYGRAKIRDLHSIVYALYSLELPSSYKIGQSFIVQLIIFHLTNSLHLNGHTVWFHLQTQELQPPCIVPPPPFP